MSMNYRTEEYYKRFIELQEKLRKSEEERLKLEMKFNEMVRVTREEEQLHYRKLRAQYKRFLEEDRRRQDRNERILRTLDRIDSRVAVLIAKTERCKLLRQQYHIYLERVYKTDQPKKPETPQVPKEATDEKRTHTDDKSDIVETYLQNLSSNKLREMLKKEEESRPRLPITITTDADEKYNYSDLYSFNHGELRPNYANTIADDIMHSIYSKQSRPSDTKLTLPKEFNNNVPSSVVSTDKFEQQPLKNYDNISSRLGKYSVDLKQHDEAKNFASEDTETDDFSESEEILYKNPSEFNKTKLNNSDMKKEPSLTPLHNNINARNDIQINPILSNTIKELPRTNVEKVLPEVIPVSKSSALPLSHVEDNLDSIKDQNLIDNKLDNEKMLVQDTSTPEENTSTGNRKALIVNQTLTNHDFSQEEPVLANPIPKTNLNQYKKDEMNLQTFDADSSQSKQETVKPKGTEKDFVPEYSDNISPDKDLSTEKPSDEQQLRKPQTETLRESLVEEVDDVKIPEKPQETFEETQKDIPAQQVQEQQLQQVVETQESHTTPTHNGEIDIVQDTIQQPLEQYNENLDSTSYDQPRYEESEQLYPQYNENAPEAQQYDDQGQYAQQYDESGQPIVQYDENSQPIQQYDETGQPIGQYPENTGELQQYDEQGQPIQQFNQQRDYDDQNQYLQQYTTPQYDEHGQLIPQYDEHGQLIPQYDEHGQLIQQYDETGQFIQQYDTQYGENQQYDETGQLIQSYDYGDSSQPQYDESGQLLQQPYEDQQYYGQEYEQNIEAVDGQNIEVQQNVEPVLPEATADSEKDVEEKKEVEGAKKTSNVMEMLDTDTESLKQDTKISHDSDFDFSNG